MLFPQRQLPDSDKESIQRYITHIYEWINSDREIYLIKKTDVSLKHAQVGYFKQKFDTELINFRNYLNNLSSSFEKIIEYIEGYKLEAKRNDFGKETIITKKINK